MTPQEFKSAMKELGFYQSNAAGTEWFWFEYPRLPNLRTPFAVIVVQFYAPKSDVVAYIVRREPRGFEEDFNGARAEGRVRTVEELEELLAPLVRQRLLVAVEQMVKWDVPAISPEVREAVRRSGTREVAVHYLHDRGVEF